jgi:hypothetical protein
MVSLALATERANAQAVEQRWSDTHGPVASTTASDEARDIAYWYPYLVTTGNRMRSDGTTEIATMVHNAWGDPFDPYQPKMVEHSVQVWPETTDRQAMVNRVVVGHHDLGKIQFMIGGRQTKASNPQEWSAMVVCYVEIHAPNQPYMRDWVYTYGENLAGSHEVLSMDIVETSEWNGPVLAVLIRTSDPPNTHTSTVLVVLDHDGQVIQLLQYDDFLVVDVKIYGVFAVGEPARYRVWAGGHGIPAMPTPLRMVGYEFDAHGNQDFFDVSSSIPGKHSYVHRMALGPGLLDPLEPDIYIVGHAVSALAGSKSEILTVRFGNHSHPLKPSYGVRWYQLYGSAGDAEGYDIAAVPGTSSGPGENTTPTMIFVAGRSQRQLSMNPPIYTDDFTTLCYRQGPSFGTVTLHWDARFQEQNGDDRAMRVRAARQVIGAGDTLAVAVVTGVRQNQYGVYDWLSVKYDETQPPGQPKTPRWHISFTSPSLGHVVPSALVGDVFGNPANTWDFWVAGSSVQPQTGQDFRITHYKELEP